MKTRGGGKGAQGSDLEECTGMRKGLNSSERCPWSVKQAESEDRMPEGGGSHCRYLKRWLHPSQVMGRLGGRRTVKHVCRAKKQSTDWMPATYST